MSTKMTTFTPEKDGFKFSNNLFQTDVFWGPLHITTGGRCGGMSYAALDCFHYNTPVPVEPTGLNLPPEGSVLNTYIYERLMKSLEGTGDQWADYLFNPLGSRTGELFNRGLKGRGEYLKLVREIDAGRPVNLCLVAPSPNPGASHQVVAYGYSAGNSLSDLEIYIYDCNYPKQTCILYPDTNSGFFRYKNKSNNRAISNNGQPTTWIAYFTDTDYIKQRPPKWDDDTKTNYTRRNFYGQNIDHRDFRKDILISANFTNARIKRTDFSSATGTSAMFVNAYGTTSNFIGAHFRNAMFTGADLRLCRFDNIDAMYALFNGARLGGANFSGAILSRTRFVNADLNKADFTKANLSQAQLQQADLNGAKLVEANFGGANLAHCKIGFVRNGSKINFDRANLDRADLRNSTFPSANFTGANLGYAVLNTVRVRNANFTSAVLCFADLRDADFRGAKLKYSNLMFADMRGAKFSGADFTGTQIIGANIAGATGIPASVRRQVGR
ncbi:MAG: pentapeptide repeat-containing protein [bacterium]